MAVPKKKTSKMKRRMRRSHHALDPLQMARCANCSTAIRPHRVCHNCGYYGGKARVDLDEF